MQHSSNLRHRHRLEEETLTLPTQNPVSNTSCNKNSNPNPKWTPLPLFPADLYLPLTFPAGQTFQWKHNSASRIRFTGPVAHHLISLSTTPSPTELCYFVHSSHAPSRIAASSLLSFLNSSVDLGRVWDEFSTIDSRFFSLAVYLRGVRILQQDPVECLFQFLCSSNNNIARMTKMVDFLASLGRRLGHVGGLDFYEFPSVERLAKVSEDELRAAGFGYGHDRMIPL